MINFEQFYKTIGKIITVKDHLQVKSYLLTKTMQHLQIILHQIILHQIIQKPIVHQLIQQIQLIQLIQQIQLIQLKKLEL